MTMDADKDPDDCDSSLELILVTLSKAFGMKPKQSVALLTNNNQYLIMACIKLWEKEDCLIVHSLRWNNRKKTGQDRMSLTHWKHLELQMIMLFLKMKLHKKNMGSFNLVIVNIYL